MAYNDKHNRNPNHKIDQGITLLELMACLSMIIVMYFLSIPFFNKIAAQLEAKNISSLIQQQLHLARNQAFISNQDLIICASNNLIHCDQQQWAQGLIVYIDRNKDRQLNKNEHIISHLEMNIKYGTFNWYGNSTHKTQIVFQSDTGLPRGSNGRFRYCSQINPHLSFDLILNQMGHLSHIPTKAC
ncbi:GspH/FimT family pseudopilin [Acinetobacter rudis]|uniref:Type II secretion system protein H n=1 Tax=Acinetobacter rudis TaxID=632955 RepID=A0AAW8J605_9GAMM|nr:GspH/FimT family pseudopilin [Acinetobacter rudis]MDQ8935502.1 GspH/FimT family pseudopilin [Acinetobacter rudis]MDQ8953576.1 GspH/FimT family pseudopilin [Acinetobacter rudis]